MTTKEIGTGGGLVGSIRRNQVAAFVILAYVSSWWAWVHAIGQVPHPGGSPATLQGTSESGS
jgi:hypothetical protein